MAKWRIVTDPFEYEPKTDSARGWAFDIERDGQRRRIRAELSRTAAASATIADESRRAVQTPGRSAVEKFLGDDDPPSGS